MAEPEQNNSGEKKNKTWGIFRASVVATPLNIQDSHERDWLSNELHTAASVANDELSRFVRLRLLVEHKEPHKAPKTK